jgi:hypothetical protein
MPGELKEEKMLLRTVAAAALVVPFLATSLPAQAAKTDVKAARAECFRKANEAANAAAADMSAGAIAMRNAAGSDAYRACCYKMGIRP